MTIILTPIAVVEVNFESSNLLKHRESYKTSNCFNSTLYKHSFMMSKGKFETTPKKLEFYNLRETNLSIGGFLADPPWYL